MKIKKSINRFINNLRSRKGPNYSYAPRDKNIYNKQIRKLLVSIVIVVIIILLKLINTSYTNKTIQIINNTINNNFDIKEDSKKILRYAKSILTVPEKVASVFSNQEDQENNEQQFISPINGIVYRPFGNEKKSNNITVFHRGIEILADNDIVVAIGDGVVTEIGQNARFKKYIKIDHGTFQSIYGYLETIDVKMGDKITIGTQIGIVSKNNNNKKILYLELRENNTPVNPLEKISIPLKSSVLR